MKKILLTFFFFFMAFTQVFGHTLQTQGSIGAVLHIKPDDDPIIGEPAFFFFEFKDKKDTFKASECECTVTILEAGKKVYEDTLMIDEAGKNSMHFSFTFPRKNIYSVIVKGTSSSNSFQSFTLTYDFRVKRDSTNQTSNSLKYIPHILGLCAFFGITTVTLIKTKLIKKGGDKSTSEK